MTIHGQSTVDGARAWFEAARRVVVLTGAGISTDSGIPDFRGPQGVWTRNPEAEKQATLSHYLEDPEVRRRSWANRLTSPIWAAEPNAGHRALVDLEAGGRLSALVTQNVDGLHLLAGSEPRLVIEIHGNARTAVCWSCGARWPMAAVLDRVRSGEDDPPCPECGGILKSATISFGQQLVAGDLRRADAAARECDLILAVGTTLTVHPACSLVPTAAAGGARVVILNAGETAMDRLADAVIRGSISELLPALVADLPPAA